MQVGFCGVGCRGFLGVRRVKFWVVGCGGGRAGDAVGRVSRPDPLKRERIVEWQAQQGFPILPNPEDPDCGNLYRNLKFPDAVYEHIGEYQEEKIKAGE